ncbi:TonB-dependent receptor [Novosphingobium sp. JCM 18896]|uniref:TonB-dependent receptor n=1 Tax=Novosphingobium sp. JCM 18896 TaxID=2989731 RepID=UPI0022222942|nr:TonB-dependent receptor [Novosphingobium sp. JCM 18896]MCW1431081.1 TonB-dependent receptor [Novosphingobium sp. JCM 18896]
MHKARLKPTLFLSTALLAGLATPALAQNADDSTTGDIIVTAQRVEQRLQDVPVSITVFNAQQLTQKNIAVATDLAVYTPSLSVNERYGPEKANFNIRGFNQDAATAPTVGVYFAEVVGVRAQGGTTSGNTVGAGAFTDLQNVQVLKGPQGTLFGRNTTGGAVLLTPAKPTSELGGYLEGTYGNYDQIRVQGALNIPLSDTFKVRIAGERNKRDGFMKNQSGVGPEDLNNVNYSYARLSLVADLTPDLENYTVFHYSDSNTRGYASKIIGCATPASPDNPLNVNVGTTGYSGTRHLQAASCAVQLARQTARGDGFYDIETRNPNSYLNIVQWQVINTTTWRASDSITVKNIASYGEFRERANFDLGASNFVIPSIDTGVGLNGQPTTGFSARRLSGSLPNVVLAGGQPYDRIVLDTAGDNTNNAAQSTFTNEFQIQGSFDKLDFVLGGYLEFARPIGYNVGRTAIFLDCARPETITCNNPLLIGSISESSTKFNFDNHGIFGQATYKITDKLSLTGGIRYTFDKIVGLTNSTRAGLSANAGTGPLFVDPVGGRLIARACTDSFRHNRTGPRADPAVVANPPALDRSVCTTVLTNKSSEPTWLLNLDYKVTPDLMVYAKYARGYRQGGLNFTNPGFEVWNPEKLDSYEIGLKSTFRGAVSGYLNLAGFYNNLTNQQVFGSLQPTAEAAATGVAGGNAVINAGKSRIYGAEVDGSVGLGEIFRVAFGYTYLNTKVKDVAPRAIQGDGSPLGDRLVGTPFGSVNPNVQAGSAFVLSPKHKFSITPTITLPVDESVGDVSLSATWVHQSSYINDGSVPKFVNGLPLGFTPATNLINLNLDWRSVAGSPVDLSLFVTNLTKEQYNVANTAAWNSAGVAEIIPNQPRFYGVRLRYTLGN